MISVMYLGCLDIVVWMLVMSYIAFGTNFHRFCGTIPANALIFTTIVLRKCDFTLLLID